MAATGTPAVPVTEFSYGPDGARYRQVLSGAPGSGFGPRTVYYVDKDYELTVWGAGSTWPGKVEERSFVSGSVVTYQAMTGGAVGQREVRFQHLDRLGSVVAVTLDGVAAPLSSVDVHGFDPWGKPRAGDWSGSNERLHKDGEQGVTSDRGFTGHEHLDPFYLIHMNGRVYDYRLGRFLSVDPIISNPANSQSINPYSYIGNNPLSGTDPTGYCPEGKTMVTGSHICQPLDSVPTSSLIVGGSQKASGWNKGPGPGQSPSSGADGAGTQQRPGSALDTSSPAQLANLSLGDFAGRLSLDGMSASGGGNSEGTLDYDFDARMNEADEIVKYFERSGLPKVEVGPDGYEIPQSAPVTPRPEATAIGADLIITSPYGDTKDHSTPHQGVDVRSKRELVTSMLPGRVTKVVRHGDGTSFGYIDVTTTLPSGKTVTWRHGHVLALPLLGAEVGAGAVLGRTNLSGTGVLHLHLQRHVGPDLEGNPEKSLDYLNSVRKGEKPWDVK